MKRTALLMCLALSLSAIGSVHKPNMPKPDVPEQSQSLLQHQQKLQQTMPFIGKHKEKPADIQLPAANLNAASIVASTASFVAQNKGKGPNASAAPGSPAKGPAVGLILACGTFLTFWVAGKRGDRRQT